MKLYRLDMFRYTVIKKDYSIIQKILWLLIKFSLVVRPAFVPLISPFVLWGLNLYRYCSHSSSVRLLGL